MSEEQGQARWRERGPRVDTLALAEAMAAIVRAAEAMADAGDLIPLHVEDLRNTYAEERRLALWRAIAHARAIRAASERSEVSSEETER